MKKISKRKGLKVNAQTDKKATLKKALNNQKKKK